MFYFFGSYLRYICAKLHACFVALVKITRFLSILYIKLNELDHRHSSNFLCDVHYWEKIIFKNIGIRTVRFIFTQPILFISAMCCKVSHLMIMVIIVVIVVGPTARHKHNHNHSQNENEDCECH